MARHTHPGLPGQASDTARAAVSKAKPGRGRSGPVKGKMTKKRLGRAARSGVNPFGAITR